MCAELADLAMQLARAAAARTLDSWAEPQPEPESAPAPAPQANHQTEPQTEPNATPAPHHPAQNASQAPTYRPTDPAVLFTRLAATVRDCIALESRIAAGTADTGKKTLTATLRADPRRAPLHEAFAFITKSLPESAQRLREATGRVDENLTDDPDQTVQPLLLLEAIANELGIDINWSKLPDKYFFQPIPLTPDLDLDDDEDARENPHATYPP